MINIRKCDENRGGKIAHISDEALKYGQELCIDKISLLTSRLYFYNRLPLTSALLRRFSEEKLSRFFLMDEYGANYNIIRKNWKPLNVRGEFGKAWRSFDSLNEKPITYGSITYKLYLSMNMNSLREFLGEILNVLSFSNAFHFKYGKRITELLRADNFMIYFKQKSDLLKTAKLLQPIISKATPRGVPFTSELFGDGLLSWGIDPPHQKKNLIPRTSWRLWVCNQLASFLIKFQKNNMNTSFEPWQLAKKELDQIGIDTKTWTPSENLYKKFEKRINQY